MGRCGNRRSPKCRKEDERDDVEKIKHLVAAVLCMTLASAWAQSTPAKPLARLANGEVVSEQDLSDYLDSRIDLRQIARNAWG